MNDHTKVEVAVIPPCDLCGQPAIADAKTRLGPWGYVCADHFRSEGCQLGLGLGQELVLRGAEPTTVEPILTVRRMLDASRETREEHEFAEGWDYDPIDHQP